MRPFSSITLTLACLFFLTGCFEVETVITVKRDGSGTVRERVVLKSDMLIMMMTVAKQMKNDDGEEKEEWSGLFKESDLRGKAREMGEGVSYRSGKIISDDGEGYEATYEFRDINTLRVKMTPDFQPPTITDTPDEENEESEGQAVPITFAFQKGSPATLVVNVPPVERNTGEKPEHDQNDEENEEGLEMARMMLKDLRVSTVIEVEGTVVESDATFREKSRIILTDIDFDKLTHDENLIRTAMKSENLSDDEAKELMKKYPGLKIELNRKTTVRFR